MERTPGTLYRESRGRVVDIVSSLGDEALTRTVAATPKWSARDVLAHLTGAAEDFSTGNVDGAGGEAWTAAQVERADGKSISELADAWNRVVDTTVGALDSKQLPLFSLWDVLTHEADLRETHRLGRLDDAVVDEAVTPLWSMFAKRYPGPGRLDVQAGERTLSMGEGEPELGAHDHAVRTVPGHAQPAITVPDDGLGLAGKRPDRCDGQPDRVRHPRGRPADPVAATREIRHVIVTIW